MAFRQRSHATVTQELDTELGRAPLRSVYRERDRVRRDALHLLGNTNGLQARTDTLIRANGQSSTLLTLTGTIPIFYQNTQYNIPMTIWIDELYPQAPPICYVTPTSTMIVKPQHRHVGLDGMCYLPYLSSWNAATSNLVELVAVLSSVFGTDPPVYARPANMPFQQPAQQRQVQQYNTQAQAQYNQQPQYNAQQQQPQQPIPSQPVPQQQQQQQPRGRTSSAAQEPKPDPPKPARPPSPSPEEKAAREQSAAIAKVTDAAQDLLRTQIRESAERVDALIATQTTLSANADTVTGGLEKLRNEQEDLEQFLALLKAKDDEITKWLGENEDRQEIDIDSAMEPGDTWSQQLLEATAADAAIEDALYTLNKALKKGSIDLAVFLKHVRRLADQQFFHRALGNKIIELQRSR